MSASLLSISVVSDAICPWCFIGKRRLEKAAAMLAPGVEIIAAWEPFQLNPHMPKAGIARREYRIGKFGSWEYSQALDRQVAEAGAQEGIAFRHDLMTRTPNTVDAHRLIWLAGGGAGDAAGDEAADDARASAGRQGKVVEALFQAYFIEGRDIGERDVLLNVAVRCGMEQGRVEQMLAGTEGLSKIANREAAARAHGISGVPSVLCNGRLLFTGALPPKQIASVLSDFAAGISVRA